MIRIQVGSSVFECQSATEAVQIHNLLNTVSTSTARQHVPTVANQASTKTIHKKYDNNAFLERLRLQDGKQLNGHEMMEVLGIASVFGVGPKLRSIAKELSNQNPKIVLDTYLTMFKDNYNKKQWSVHVPAQLF